MDDKTTMGKDNVDGVFYHFLVLLTGDWPDHQESIRKNNGVSRRLHQEQQRQQRRSSRAPIMLRQRMRSCAHAMQSRHERRVGDGEHLIAVCHADEVLDDVGVDPV